MIQLSKIFTANRVAAIVTWLTGLGAFIVSVEGTLPKSWQNLALGAVGVIGSTVTALHFMSGSQKYDQLVAHSTDVQNTYSPLTNMNSDSSDTVQGETTEDVYLDDGEGTPESEVTAGLAPDPPNSGTTTGGVNA